MAEALRHVAGMCDDSCTIDNSKDAARAALRKAGVE
jgi:hypothetical protein